MWIQGSAGGIGKGLMIENILNFAFLHCIDLFIISELIVPNLTQPNLTKPNLKYVNYILKIIRSLTKLKIYTCEITSSIEIAYQTGTETCSR